MRLLFAVLALMLAAAPSAAEEPFEFMGHRIGETPDRFMAIYEEQLRRGELNIEEFRIGDSIVELRGMKSPKCIAAAVARDGCSHVHLRIGALNVERLHFRFEGGRLAGVTLACSPEGGEYARLLRMLVGRYGPADAAGGRCGPGPGGGQVYEWRFADGVLRLEQVGADGRPTMSFTARTEESCAEAKRAADEERGRKLF